MLVFPCSRRRLSCSLTGFEWLRRKVARFRVVVHNVQKIPLHTAVCEEFWYERFARCLGLDLLCRPYPEHGLCSSRGQVRSLSTGERKRLSLATQLLHEPDVIILDGKHQCMSYLSAFFPGFTFITFRLLQPTFESGNLSTTTPPPSRYSVFPLSRKTPLPHDIFPTITACICMPRFDGGRSPAHTEALTRLCRCVFFSPTRPARFRAPVWSGLRELVEPGEVSQVLGFGRDVRAALASSAPPRGVPTHGRHRLDVSGLAGWWSEENYVQS